jgi:hypothetical protein
MSLLLAVAAVITAAASASTSSSAATWAGRGPPSVTNLASQWVDPMKNISAAAGVGPEQRDLATINNFWGASGIAPQTLRPVDLVAVNSLELPPYVGCGAAMSADLPASFGCGRLFIDNRQPTVAATRWQAHEAGRRTAPLPGSGVTVESAMRMPFEQNGVIWQVTFTAPPGGDAKIRLDFELSAMVNKLPSVGTWVYPTVHTAESFNFSTINAGDKGQKGVLSCGGGNGTWSRSACSRFIFVGALQPDKISFNAHSPVPNATFSALHIKAGGSVTIRLALAVADDAAGAIATANRFAADAVTFGTAFAEAHSKWEGRWHQAFEPKNGYWSGSLPTLSLPGAVGANVARVYYMSALTVISQMRSNLPLLGPRVWPNGNGNVIHNGLRGIGGTRSWWWDESLTSIMLALLEPASRAPTFQAWLAHDDHPGTKFGHGMGNGYPMDCAPIGRSGTKWGVACPFPNASTIAVSTKKLAPPQPPVALEGPEYGFYCYNPWAYYMMASNHLRVNNDTRFLHMQAASSNQTVEDVLEGIATDFEEYLIPGTNLVDYGPDMDGFSPTYKHVMPGCSQGNSVWMLRDFAAYRESQGGVANTADAARLRKMAAGLASETMSKMYQSSAGLGWFNVIFPGASDSEQLTVRQMRHVVDFFSVTFGLCGITDQPCDFPDTMRRELGDWFRQESVTSSWIRATSPKCNCSRSYTIPKDADAATTANAAATTSLLAENAAEIEAEWPAYTTCHAGRPDHGSNGAYPSWPAFAVEALCYVDGNCSSAFEIMSSFSQATYEGPFGQAHEVPQLKVEPFTPFNHEPSFKPIAGDTRYIAIEGGSFFDSIVRGFFGYHAPLQWGDAGAGSSAQEQLTAALNNPSMDRGFVGSLSNLRTPHGLATITAGAEGLVIKLQ